MQFAIKAVKEGKAPDQNNTGAEFVKLLDEDSIKILDEGLAIEKCL